jgi:hypothetical protein
VNTYAATSEKRQRKPLAIVDPVSHKPVDVPVASSSTTAATNTTSTSSTITTNETRSTESTTTDSSASTTKSTNDTNKTQIQAEFRRQVAEKLGDSSNAQTDKV